MGFRSGSIPGGRCERTRRASLGRAWREADCRIPQGPQAQGPQDGREPRRYERHWKVERYFAWLRFFRRLVTRYEVKAENFLGFLHLACALILMRQF
ncbi:transposase [Corallococcus exiguus]|uniref:Transposase n=1 Tax=Corallococcus exiguus TaxID=83462 RepID=A0A7X4YA03_9BACT|nr:transposase [Corallococcus exiguus]TNV66975.1 transposase [Corallococcus exiguus]